MVRALLLILASGCSYAPGIGQATESDGPITGDDAPGDSTVEGDATATPDTSSFVCQPTYTLEPTLLSSYRKVNNAVQWLTAELDCESDGGHLVVVNNANEETFVGQQAGGADMWIGLSDRATEATWIWVTQTDLLYMDFASGQPGNNNNAAADQDCGEFGGGWHDDFCNVTNVYLCECDGQPAVAARY